MPVIWGDADKRLAHLIHQEAEGEWRFSRNSRQRSCALRLFHRWDLVSGAGAGGFGTVWRGDRGPAAYGAAGISPAAMWRMRRASGQAAAEASRTREAVSMTRVPSFKRRSRRVVNSAVARACALGIASRTVRISQYAAVCRIRRIWLASGLRQLVRSRGELSFVQLDQVLGLAAGTINRLVNRRGAVFFGRRPSGNCLATRR